MGTAPFAPWFGEPADRLVTSNLPDEKCTDELQKRMERASMVLDHARTQLRSLRGGRNEDSRLDAAQEEDQRYRELVDGIDAVVWETNRDGRVLFVNQRTHELFGYPAERWHSLKCFWHEIAHPGDRVYAMANFFECSRHGQDRELEYRIIAADGRTIWVREGLRPVLDRNGHVEGVRGVMWNIGRRKKIERQLQVARSELADQLADVMHLHDLSRRLWATPEPGPLLEEILVAVTAIQGAEMGMVQLYRRPEADLEIVASVGLCEQYLARYARVPRVESAAGLAIDGPGPVIIEDVETEPTACAYREEFRTGGYRTSSRRC